MLFHYFENSLFKHRYYLTFSEGKGGGRGDANANSAPDDDIPGMGDDVSAQIEKVLF